MSATTWNRVRLYDRTGTKEKAVAWSQANGLLPTTKECRKHRCPMSIDYNRSGLGQFRCRRNGCSNSASIAKGTWFENARLDISRIYRFAYFLDFKAFKVFKILYF